MSIRWLQGKIKPHTSTCYCSTWERHCVRMDFAARALIACSNHQSFKYYTPRKEKKKENDDFAAATLFLHLRIFGATASAAVTLLRKVDLSRYRTFVQVYVNALQLLILEELLLTKSLQEAEPSRETKILSVYVDWEFLFNKKTITIPDAQLQQLKATVGHPSILYRLSNCKVRELGLSFINEQLQIMQLAIALKTLDTALEKEKEKETKRGPTNAISSLRQPQTWQEFFQLMGVVPSKLLEPLKNSYVKEEVALLTPFFFESVSLVGTQMSPVGHRIRQQLLDTLFLENTPLYCLMQGTFDICHLLRENKTQPGSLAWNPLPNESGKKWLIENGLEDITAADDITIKNILSQRGIGCPTTTLTFRFVEAREKEILFRVWQWFVSNPDPTTSF